MAAAKKSAMETLHRLYVASLVLELQAGQPSAAVLSVIGSFLAKSGVKATEDSPAMQRLAKAYDSLPFTTASEIAAIPAPSPKDQH
jgi:hypothetical protein